MPIRPAVVALVGALLTSALPAGAQQPLPPADSTEAHLRTTLRAFYFSLAHQDWEALSADILPAKVVAHRPVPAALALAARLHARPAGSFGSASAADDPPACASNAPALVDQAMIILDGDWAEVMVPHCVKPPNETDEFRFVRFEGRWWIVYINLFG